MKPWVERIWRETLRRHACSWCAGPRCTSRRLRRAPGVRPSQLTCTSSSSTRPVESVPCRGACGQPCMALGPTACAALRAAAAVRPGPPVARAAHATNPAHANPCPAAWFVSMHGRKVGGYFMVVVGLLLRRCLVSKNEKFSILQYFRLFVTNIIQSWTN